VERYMKVRSSRIVHIVRFCYITSGSGLATFYKKELSASEREFCYIWFIKSYLIWSSEQNSHKELAADVVQEVHISRCIY
jgi:hypothetical protein